VLDGSRVFTFKVRRCNLYLFHSGVVVLAVEFDSGADPVISSGGNSIPLNLRDVQEFTEKTRRCYPPYFKGQAAQQVPTSVRWLGPNNSLIGGSDGFDASKPGALASEYERIRLASSPETRTAPVFQHWIDLLNPLALAGYSSGAKGPIWRQTVDERIPTMSYVSLTGSGRAHYDLPKQNPDQSEKSYRAMQDLRVVRRGDWIRLCYADAPGENPLPYNPVFLRDFERTACYDRHFPSEATESATRFMFAGHHAIAVGAGGFFDDTLIHHFCRHYFQMGLILHMEFASLLAVSSRISGAVRQLHKKLTDKSDRNDAPAYARFSRSMIGIEQGFLEALHLFRFTGLSNQIQPREMYEAWRKTLGMDEMFSDLKDELDAATQFLLSQQQLRRADAANNLATIAAIGVVLGLAFSFLGMNVVMSGDTIGDILAYNNQASWTKFFRELLPLGVVISLAARNRMADFALLVSPYGGSCSSIHTDNLGRGSHFWNRLHRRIESELGGSNNQSTVLLRRSPRVRYRFFLGGHDLEMEETRSLLGEAGLEHAIVDASLSWGAAATAYEAAIRQGLASGETPVLIELEDDLPPDIDRRRIILIDHHGERAGADKPSALRQVYDLVSSNGRPRWTRRRALVEANDVDHVRGLRRMGASAKEIRAIRDADRRAQGITDEIERESRRAVESAKWRDGLTLVQNQRSDIQRNCRFPPA
jgi:hypothetical protein